MSAMLRAATADVMRCAAANPRSLQALASSYELKLNWVTEDAPIPGSFWGEDEAGLVEATIYVRNDTPIHSFLHELCHFVCMTCDRRRHLHTNAGGDYAEENAVCYLQILLADTIHGFGHNQCLLDMDTWGYSFRLGSARRWFEQDAEDALASLIGWELLNQDGRPNGRLRT